jgi:alkanesulfonate monooxygenase SsuD/methylene tetrahydromethanopterin reductase-like flavin-dependent oxidoreductase (luciferase family)
VAGARAPVRANYHISPRGGRRGDATAAGPGGHRPHVACRRTWAASDDEARELATGYGLWAQHPPAEGAIPFPTPDEARRHRWTDEDRALVQDRVDTQFTGSPATVAERLDVLARATGADEVVVTTITHDHADRVRSYELLAREWTGSTTPPGTR